MKANDSSPHGPIALAVILSSVFGLIALFWMDGSFWCGVALSVLLGFLVAVIVTTQWSTFRLTMRIFDRLKRLEQE